MSAHAIIAARLAATPGITALVFTRIYPSVMPDNPAYPAITFHQIGGSGEKGAVVNPGLMRAIVQVTAWSKSPRQVRDLADQIRKALDRMRAVTVGGFYVNDCFYEGDTDLYDPPTKTYWVPISFRLHFKDTP
jgi:hypothetical protein